MEETILQLFPASGRAYWRTVAACQEDIREIRLRADRPIIVYRRNEELFLDSEGNFTDSIDRARVTTGGELEGLLEHICNYSLYAFEEELRQGFLTVGGGHRVGVAGQAVLNEEGRVRTIKNICFLNIRVAHEIKGAADDLLPMVYQGGRLKSTLIISPPGCGKTTLLRDLVRQVSDGNRYSRGMTVGMVDERSEIAGAYCGKPQNDVGMRTDVLDACPKELGMMLLLRAMSPEVIAIDELGSQKELEALRCASACGCSILATAHGDGVEDVKTRFGREEAWEHLFQQYVLLGRKGGNCFIRSVVGGGTGCA